MKGKQIKNNIWYPYTQMKTDFPPIKIVRGKGALLYDANGTEYIDGISSWWVNLHGHSNPFIAKKLFEQLNELEHVIFAGFTHPKALELAYELLKILPGNQKKVFFSDNGSTAVEVGIKMAIQYWHNKGIKKNKIIAFKNGYHGDTFGSMSVGARGVFTEPFRHYLFKVQRIDEPYYGRENNCLNQFKKLINNNDIAAFIFEPMIQGAGGMLIYNGKILKKLIDKCKQNNIITIADEVMTGFGRTGKYFAIDHISIQPDIICLSKGITGGTLPLGVTTCTNKIYNAFLSDDRSKTFFHGHSYTGNPIGCAAALASLKLLKRKSTWKNIRTIENEHKLFANELKKYSIVKNIRVLGTILAFDIKTKNKTEYLNSIRDMLYRYFIEHEILLRPLGNIIYIMPPYCIKKKELQRIYKVILNFLDSLQMRPYLD